MLDKYVYGSHGAMLVYDVTNYASFENLEDWVNCIRKFTQGQEKPCHLSLIANKCDLEHMRTVKVDKHQKFAEKHGMSSYMVSAKTGDSLILAFKAVAAEILGIQMTAKDLEQQIQVVKAEIPAAPSSHNEKQLRPVNQSKKSSVCSIQ